MIVILCLLILVSMGSQVLESCKMTKLRVQKCCNKRKAKKGVKYPTKKPTASVPGDDKPNDMSFGPAANIDDLVVKDDQPTVSKKGKKSRKGRPTAEQQRIVLDQLEMVSEKSDEEDISVYEQPQVESEDCAFCRQIR